MAIIHENGQQHIVRGLPFVYDNGGRSKAGFKGRAGDCVCRSIAIATGEPYEEIYRDLNGLALSERPRVGRRSSAREGVKTATIRKFMKNMGWQWQPTMQIGSGCRVHLREGELPSGRLVVRVSGHVTAVIDGVIHDTHDCSRDGMRCVYGYWYLPNG